jgi:hypothetical protein
MNCSYDERDTMTQRTIAKTRKTETKTKAPKAVATPAATFTRGQKWQLQLGHAEVVHVGKVLIDYRYYRVETQKHVPVETKTLVEFAEALKKQKAKLIA